MRYAIEACTLNSNTITPGNSITGPCHRCGKPQTVYVPENAIERWQAGEHIQDIHPDLTAAQREFLMSGICGDCWQTLFAPVTDEEIENEFCQDIIDTALEFGISYWVEAATKARNGKLEIKEDGGGWHILSHDTIRAGIERIKEAEFQINRDLRAQILAADVDKDATDIDSELSDVIVQAGIFGEIVYG